MGACWDNVVVERFFGNLKHDWMFKVAQPTIEHMMQDVAAYVKYYSLERLHSSSGDQSLIEFEHSFRGCQLDLTKTVGADCLVNMK